MVSNKGQEEAICAVCGDHAFGRHYGANCCNGCKGFFRRSIWSDRSYKCHFVGSCNIAKEQRNTCRFCRLQKCIAAGLNPRAIQNERDRNAKKGDSVPLMAVHYLTTSLSTGTAAHASTQTAADNELLPCSDADLDRSTAVLMALEHRVMTRVDDFDLDDLSSATFTSSSVSLADAIRNPSLVTRRTPLIITGERIATLEDALQDYRRAFVLYADWLHDFEELQLFSKADQMRLTQNRFSSFYWSLCASWTVRAGCDGTCYANGTYFPRIKELQCINDVRQVSERFIRELADPMRALDLDETEFCLMRVISFFAEGGRRLTELVRDFFIRALIRHIRVYRPYISDSAIGCRVAKIMLLTTSLATLNHLTNDNIRLSEVLKIVDWDRLTCELSHNPQDIQNHFA